MRKTYSTKRPLIMALLALVLCLSMLVGTTFAWFTDSVSSDRNTIQAGNLDIKLEYSVQENGQWTDYAEVDANTDIYGYQYWEPGFVRIAKFRITNIGTLSLKYQLTTDVYAETAGINKAGEEFLLSDFLYAAVVDADATREEILSSTDGKRLKAPVNGQVNTDLIIKSNALEQGQSTEVAMAIWMPTTVGNEANHNGTAPSIEFGINLIAGQYITESDSFGNTYDENATYPVVAWSSTTIHRDPVTNEPTAANYPMDLLLANGSKVGYVDIPADAIDPNAKDVVALVKETETYANVTVASDQNAKTFNITVDGLKANNDVPVPFILDVGTNLTGVKLYHYDQEITGIHYKEDSGQLSFSSADFSPFTVVYDAVAVEENIEDLRPDVPVAIVTDADDCEGVDLNWTGWGGFNPWYGDEQFLDSAYLFTSPDTYDSVQESLYKDWCCDYYVKFVPGSNFSGDVLPERSITLGGNYGGYGWVGFDNPEVPVDTFIPLIGSVLGDCLETGAAVDPYWTYEAVVQLVTEFWCGVGQCNGCTTDLTGSQFVVELRLTNPEDYSDQIAVNRVTYTFGATENASVIENYPQTIR